MHIMTFVVIVWFEKIMAGNSSSHTIIRGSSLNANYHKVDELCGSQITSVIYDITVLL